MFQCLLQLIWAYIIANLGFSVAYFCAYFLHDCFCSSFAVLTEALYFGRLIYYILIDFIQNVNNYHPHWSYLHYMPNCENGILNQYDKNNTCQQIALK